LKILVVTQYFYPENFRINDVVLGLKEMGHEVKVLTGKPNYPKGYFYEGYSFFSKAREKWCGITILRAPLFARGKSGGIRLMINYLSFAFFATLKTLLIKDQFDVIFVYEPSPITVGLPAIALGKRKRIPIVFWVQDLWPESVQAAGQISDGLVLNLIDKYTRWTYKNSEKILIQSPGFEQYILNQGVSRGKIIYFPNSTEELYKIVQPADEIKDLVPVAPFTVMFAGNLGEAQDFENIIAAAKIILIETHDIHFVILGDGRKRKEIEEMTAAQGLTENFHILGGFPPATMPDFFALSDALLVSLKDERIFSLTIPSKVQSYMACGKPIVASLGGTAAQIVLEADAGRSAIPGNADSLAQAILDLYNLSEDERNRLGQNALKYSKQHFHRGILLNKLVVIFQDVIKAKNK
jgi:glycosyltransferase involved in cell wall biosynthesis